MLALLSHSGSYAWAVVTLGMARILTPRVTGLIALALLVRDTRPAERHRLLVQFLALCPAGSPSPVPSHAMTK